MSDPSDRGVPLPLAPLVGRRGEGAAAQEEGGTRSGTPLTVAVAGYLVQGRRTLVRIVVAQQLSLDAKKPVLFQGPASPSPGARPGLWRPCRDGRFA